MVLCQVLWWYLPDCISFVFSSLLYVQSAEVSCLAFHLYASIVGFFSGGHVQETFAYLVIGNEKRMVLIVSRQYQWHDLFVCSLDDDFPVYLVSSYWRMDLKIGVLCTRRDLETLFCVLLLVHGNEGKGRTLIMVSWSYTALSIYDWFQLCFTGRYPNGPSSLDMFEHIYTVNSDLKPICILLPSWLGRWWVGTNYCTMRSKDHKDNMEGDPEEYWGLVDKDTKQQEELHI